MTTVNGFLLSPQQERTWHLHRQWGERRSVLGLNLAGQVSEREVRSALQALAARHEILRTRFEIPAGLKTPLQVVEPEARYHLTIDPTLAPPSPERLNQALQALQSPGFWPQPAPALCAALLTGQSPVTLFLALPALCCDERSMEVLAADFLGLLVGTCDPAEEPVQFTQFSQLLHELLAEDEEGKAFWESVPAPAEWTPAAPWNPRSVSLPLAEATVASLTRVAQILAVSPEILLLAAWQVFLCRHRQTDRLTVGVAFDNRPGEDLADAIGPFARHLPLVAELDLDRSFDALVRQTAASVEAIDTWQLFYCPRPHRALPFLFAYQPPAETAFASSRLQAEPVVRCHLAEPCCLRLRNDGLTKATLDYDANNFSDLEAREMLEQWRVLLHALERHPAAALGRLPLLTAQQRSTVLVAFNRNDAFQSPEFCPFHWRFQQMVALYPERPALVSGDRQLTFAALERQATRLALRLHDSGIAAETIVALCLPACAELVTAMLAVAMVGAAFLPMDPTQPAGRLAAILADSGAPLVLAREPSREMLGQTGVRCLVLPDDEVASAEPAESFHMVPVRSQQAAYVIYTSGSTGTPKGVVVSHGNLANYCEAVRQALDLRAGFSYLAVSSPAADLAGTMIYPALCGGGTLHLAPQACITSGAAMADYLVRHRIDCLKITPSHLRALRDPDAPGAGLPAARLVLGGEESPRAWVASLAADAGSPRVFNHYGPTETTIGVATCLFDDTCPERCFPVGRPLGGNRIFLLNSQGEPVAPGQRGELHVGGAQVARGYLGKPAQTASAFVPDPFGEEPGGRLYRTGDLAHFLADGRLVFQKRADRQVKIRGFRVELGEIEATLQAQDQVEQAVALAHNADSDEPTLVAFITGKDLKDVAEVRACAAARLPDYMLPSQWVLLPRMPLTSNGKLDRKVLVSLIPRAHGAGEGLARTAAQIALQLLWHDLLGGTLPNPGVSFFNAGGNSLLLIRMNNRIRRLFGVELGVDQLFQAATIEEMARLLEKSGMDALQRGHLEKAIAQIELEAAGDSPAAKLESLEHLIAATRAGHIPRATDPGPALLSFAQQRLWFLHKANPTNAFLNNPYAVRVSGHLEVATLWRCFARIQERHESLRTLFTLAESEPVQIVQPAGAPLVPLIDLSGLGSAVQEEAGKAILAAEAARPFDLERGPVWRISLLRLDADTHVLALTMHHICSDGWSMRLLVHEAGEIYEALLQERPAPLPPLPIQYSDYARWQRARFQGDRLAKALAYWKDTLAQAPPAMSIAASHARGELPTYNGAMLPVHYPADLTGALADLAERRGATLFMTALAAFYALLHFYSKQDDLVVGTDFANREREEVERLIGFFVNQLVLRTRLHDNPSLEELIDRVRHTCMAAYAHGEVPFDQVVKAAGVARDARVSPLFQIKFFLVQEITESLDNRRLRFTPIETRNPSARLDVTLGLWHRGGELSGWFNYNTDLFEEQTVIRMERQFHTLLETMTRTPATRLNELAATLATREQALITEQQNLRRRTYLGRLQQGRRRTVSLDTAELMSRRLLSPAGPLPLVLEPRPGLVDLVPWLKENSATWRQWLHRHGALLFRGFGIDSIQHLQACAGVLLETVFKENSEHQPISADGVVQIPVAYAADQRLLWHNENTFNQWWPAKILFACARPASSGGATPLVDGRQVYQRMKSDLREKFLRLGILYLRNYKEGLGIEWQKIFNTSDKHTVEARCRKEGISFSWLENNQLQTRAVRPAIGKHPVTGEPVWWAQPLHWHSSCLDDTTRAYFSARFEEHDFPRNCYFGDGQPIDDVDITHLRELHQSLEISEPWQKGDLVLVDNLLTSHGRQPFTGDRKLLVAMGDLIDSRLLKTSPEGVD